MESPDKQAIEVTSPDKSKEQIGPDSHMDHQAVPGAEKNVDAEMDRQLDEEERLSQSTKQPSMENGNSDKTRSE